MSKPIRVGIVGANAERGWAHDSHLPALKQLPDFIIAGVSARNAELAEQARVVFGAQRAFGDSLAMVRDPDIDLIAVTVKVPEHRAVVLAALAADKHVYCEWPLGRDLAESIEMAAAVRPQSHVAIGLQALSAPAIRQAIELMRNNAIGKPQIMRVFSPTAGWGLEVPPHYAYLQDKQNGATLETIAGGHTLAAMEAIAGSITSVDVRKSIRAKNVRISGSGETAQRTCADHMFVLAEHEGGCVSSLEVIGGVPNRPFLLELEGEKGWIRITGAHPGGYQVANLKLETNVATEPTPAAVVPGLTGAAANVAEAYTRLLADIRSGQRTMPDFERAVTLTRLLDAIDSAD